MERAEFEAEADRLLQAARGERIVLRLVGALAYRRRCPQHAELQDRFDRRYTDIDFAAYGRQARKIQGLFAAAGYSEDPGVHAESQGSRLVFWHPTTGLHLDVFLDRLEFSHTISWNGRLELDDETIPLAELLLEKMQIFEINQKDLIDTMMLLIEHPLGQTDRDTINIDHVASLLARDWGFWRTATMNLGKVAQLAGSTTLLQEDEQRRVQDQVASAVARIEAEPKSLGWRMRARVGDRKKWYREVSEL